MPALLAADFRGARPLLRGGPTVMLALVLVMDASRAAGQSVWEFTPYRIRAVVAAATDPELAPGMEAELCARIAERAGAVVGAAWELAIAPAPARLRSAMLADIEHLAVEALPGELLEGDKALLLAVLPEAGAYRVVARELDVRTRLWGTTARRPVWQLGKLRDQALDALLEAFVPVARVERVEKQQVQLRLKASGLPPRDPELALVRPGDVFRPILRQTGRDGKLRRVMPVPWTFCLVEKVEPEMLHCRICSGLRTPLAGRRRGRVEQLALRVADPKRPSTLVLQSRSETKQALAGYDIYAHAPDSKTIERLGATDGQGRLVVPPSESPLRVLVVKSGGELLARVPMVPGVEPEVLATIPNDDDRLEAEAFITGLQEQLVDVVARRDILVVRIRRWIETRQFDKAASLLEDLRGLPDKAEFARLLAEQQKRLTSKDPAVQKKIDALLGDTQKLIEQRLDDKTIEQVGEELTKARSSPGPARPSDTEENDSAG